MKSIELFAGAGGLAIGLSRAGFDPVAIIERDRWCCDTLTENRFFEGSGGAVWPIPTIDDVRRIDFRDHEGLVDLVSGGPPCQPFSLGGLHQAQNDDRNMWPEAVRAVREVRPAAFIFENVRGLARAVFSDYLNYIALQLSFPSLAARADEPWDAHRARLRAHSATAPRAEYSVRHALVDAANYGVAQNRHRIMFVGFRDDIEPSWTMPRATHSREALVRAQQSGEYWDRHHVPLAERIPIALREVDLIPPVELPWVTVRDALMGLPDPTSDEASNWFDHRHRDGARSYPGHTGSPIDHPAKALKAGVHGVPGGENMLRMPDNIVRYFTVREAARLQAFPDTWRFHGSASEAMRQLGNAVPTTLGEVVARSVRAHLASSPSLPATRSNEAPSFNSPTA